MRRTSFVPTVCALLALALVAAGFVLVRPAWVFSLNVGAEGPLVDGGQAARFANFYSLYGRERWQADGQLFRWTKERLTLTVPYTQRAGQSILAITLCGCRPTATEPAELFLNHGAAARFVPTADWRVYQILTPASRQNADYGLFLDLRTPTARADDGRDLGLALRRIELREAAPSPVADLPSALSVLVVGIFLACTGRIRLTPLLALAWLAVGYTYVPQLLPAPLVLALLAVGLAALWSIANGWWQVAIASAIGVWLTSSMQILGTWVVDDAYISFQYARNLLLGHGLVFNPGERVEGYTNFLWTIAAAVALAARMDPLIAAQAVTLALGFALVLIAVLTARCLDAGGWAWAAGGLLALSGPFLLYTARGSGMETGLYAALVALALLLLLRRAWLWAGITVALALLTRPDAVVLATGAALYALASGLRTANLRPAHALGIVVGRGASLAAQADLRPAKLVIGPIVAIFGSYFVWRWWYYSAPLPNTFYAKVDSSQDQLLRGVRYLWDFARLELLPLAGIVGGAVASRRARGDRAQTMGVNLLLLYVAMFAVYIAAVGGDWVPGVRFGVPLLAPLAVLTAAGLAALAARRQRGRAAAGAILVALGVALALRLPAESSFNTESGVWNQMYRVRRFREIGLWLYANTRPGTLVAANAVGALPYFAERPTLDVLGLTDAHIARTPARSQASGLAGHERGDPDYVMARQPAIVTYYAAAYLDDHPALDREYERCEFDGPEGMMVNLYVRRGMAISCPGASVSR